jgi:hypothetical protein
MTPADALAKGFVPEDTERHAVDQDLTGVRFHNNLSALRAALVLHQRCRQQRRSTG